MKKNYCLTGFLLVKKTKHFIGYLYNEYKVKPLHIMLPKTSVYVESYEGQTKMDVFFDWRWWFIGKI